MATATLYLYEDPTQQYGISCWADRQFSRGPATVRKTANVASTSYPFTTIQAGSITAGNIVSMPRSNTQNLIFSYTKLSNYKINIESATLYVTLASDTTFDSILVGNQSYNNPVYNIQYSGTIDLSNVNTLEQTITAPIAIDPYMSATVLAALGGDHSWSVQTEATPTEDVFSHQDTASTYVFTRYYRALSGIQRSWCSAKITNIYLVVEYEEDTSVIVDRSTTTALLNIGVSGKAKKVSDIFVGVNGIARKISEAWIGVNGAARKIYPACILGLLSPGDILQIDENGDGTFTDWIVMHQNYYGNNATVLMRKTILTNKQLDESGGVNQYGYPYAEQEADNYLRITWLQAKSATFQNLLIETPIVARTWSGTTKTINRKVWLPAAVNLSGSKSDFTESDRKDDPSGAFSYFISNDTNSDRIAYNSNGTIGAWWTRSPVGGSHPLCRAINNTGGFNNWNYYNNIGLRPVINIASNTLLEKVSENAYRIIKT